ncbi:HD domain-containing protein [Streptomyces sp. Ag109_O5-10]|uniref:HD domain-containing protein n=1 Tax=Streptomyces sp. Ag109_O5-10 TaxID=1855349 RepID=UPI0008978709|nr:HD domain-containing protein [Streptomyces sp. Ag109_O5-10]SEE21112.1 HD domain-containing protein [Streptomyces sp. Ag109_O5-10]
MSEIIAGVEIPETAAVAEATRLMQEMTSPLIYHHSRRVFVFGAIHAHRLGVEPDPELLYLSAMFHDTGLLTPFSDVEQRFEVDGADHASKQRLTGRDHRRSRRRRRCERTAGPRAW